MPLDLVGQLLADIAGVLHDRPIQSIVAAKLLVETAAATSGEDGAALQARGLHALDTAGQLSRDVMWALQPFECTPDRLRADLGDHFDRVADPAGLDIHVDLAVDVPARLLRPVMAALHAAVAGAALRGARMSAVQVVADQASLQVTATLQGPSARGRAWDHLATHHLRRASGDPTWQLPTTDGERTLALAVPLPG